MQTVSMDTIGRGGNHGTVVLSGSGKSVWTHTNGKVRELFEAEPDDCPAAMRYRNLVVHPLVPRGEITLLEKQQEQHPWYRPTLAQLAWYADPLYYDETPESKVFQRYLRDRFSLTGTRSRYCLGVFSGYVRRGRGGGRPCGDLRFVGVPDHFSRRDAEHAFVLHSFPQP